MYKEIHPFFCPIDNSLDALSTPAYKEMPSIVIRLDSIRLILPEPGTDSMKMARLRVSDDYLQDIIVLEAEAEEIKKELLSPKKDNVATEISHLTIAIRDLWNLLRARLR